MEMDSAEAIGRLRAASFQLHEIVCLIEETDRCVEALRRLHQVQTGLRQVHDGLLESHLAGCLEALGQSEDRGEAALDGIGEVFCWMNRAGL